MIKKHRVLYKKYWYIFNIFLLVGIFRVLRNDMTLIYLNNTIQNVILNIVLIKKITGN
nr:MAG TPA: hypothetical protein [Caudoviricetes sp.]